MTDHVRLIRSATLTDQVDYAYAAVVPRGSGEPGEPGEPGEARWIFTAGACPLDADGTTVAVGDYAGQAETVMDNLVTALADAGADLSDVVKTTVYVATTRQEDLVTAWEVVRARFGDHDAPGTLIGVTVLGYDHQLVEVEATAFVPAR